MEMKKILLVFFALALLTQAWALELPEGVQKLAQYQNELAAGITILMAFAAGLITFTSPCGFALLPAYFSFAFKSRRQSLYMASSFSLGLVGAFVLFGVIAGFAAGFFNKFKLEFAVFSGVVIVFFGILLMLNRGFGGLNFQSGAEGKKTFFGMLSFGFFFGAGWTPCVGPVLAGIILVGANLGNVASSALLLGAYALGVVLPLLVISVFADKYDLAKKFKGKPVRFSLLGKEVQTYSYNILGGAILAALGILMIAYQGTFFFQSTMTEYVPWSMGLWYELNGAIATSPLLGEGWVNYASSVLLLAVAGAIMYAVVLKKSKLNFPKSPPR